MLTQVTANAKKRLVVKLPKTTSRASLKKNRSGKKGKKTLM